jgi:hypothetical protein
MGRDRAELQGTAFSTLPSVALSMSSLISRSGNRSGTSNSESIEKVQIGER